MFGIQTFVGSLTCWVIFGGSLLAAHLVLYLSAAIRNNSLTPPNAGFALFLPYFVVGLLCLFRATPFMVTVAAQDSHIVAVLLAGAAMTVLGLAADRRFLRFRYQLLAQGIVALGVCLAGVTIHALEFPIIGIRTLGSGVGLLITTIWLVAFTNSLRLLDGLDRLSSVVAFGCLMTLALISSLNISTLVVLLCLSLAGATLGLLLFNFNPVQCQLGWSGKYFLGFSIGAIAVLGAHKTTAILVYLIPLLLLAFQIPQFRWRQENRHMPAISIEPEPGLLNRGLIRLIISAAVAGISYAVFDAGGAEKSWWFVGKARYVLLATIFGITFLALNLRPVRKAWFHHRRRLLLVALGKFFRDQLHQSANYQKINSLLAIAQEELALAGLEVTCHDGGGLKEELGFRPQSRRMQIESPLPYDEFNIAGREGLTITVRASHPHSTPRQERGLAREWLEETLAQWQPSLPLARAIPEETRDWPTDADGCLIFPTPDILGEWNGTKSSITF